MNAHVTGVQVRHGRLTGVHLATGRSVPADAVFVAPRLRARDALLRRLGARTDHSPVASWVAVDGTGRTSVDGIWAAGNVADPSAQVIGAAGAGSRADIAINGDLVAEDTARAVRGTRAAQPVAGTAGRGDRSWVPVPCPPAGHARRRPAGPGGFPGVTPPGRS